MVTDTQTPAQLGYRMPAEWEAHRAVWLAWPCHQYAWGAHLGRAQAEFVQLCKTLAGSGEQLELLVGDRQQEASEALALAGVSATFHPIFYGDIWLRDTGPLFVVRNQDLAGVVCGFNGWGEKFRYPYDEQVAAAVLASQRRQRFDLAPVVEGGAIEVDGEGTCMTTRDCLLNRNRNPGRDEAQLTQRLCDALGVTRVLWLDGHLQGDHTDGHVDNLARFVSPGKVLCMEPVDADDPNGQMLQSLAEQLAAQQDAAGRSLEVETLPSPGRVLDGDGNVMPASYLNYYVANGLVVMPTFGRDQDGDARQRLQACFPDREVVGLPARALLEGGGTIHCITQQEPRVT